MVVGTTDTTHDMASVKHYFVDEAGDGTLFDRKGRVIIGQEGCSRFFLLGFVDISDPETLSQKLDELRKQLLADPYFAKVPSMQHGAKKTCLAFHAKDDVPEVRREVFNLIHSHQQMLRFHAVIREKHNVVEYVGRRNKLDLTYHYNPNDLYDYLVRCLFKQNLHKHDQYNICFSKRGNSNRTVALQTALETTRERFCTKLGIAACSTISITSATPRECASLQLVDYFLWALQRMYERREDRYIEFLWPMVNLVIDLDDTRKAEYGAYYTQKKPLTLAALKELPGI